MKFESKFDIGETVYYWSVEKVKILFGRIESISLRKSENKKPYWRYGIRHINPKSYLTLALNEQVPEHLVFRKRDDVFDFLYEIDGGYMIKNERHSHAAKMLARAIKLFKAYQNNLELAKYNLQVSRYDPYDRYSFHYKCEIKDCKYMINQLQKEIREWKQEIYKAQTEYHKIN